MSIYSGLVSSCIGPVVDLALNKNELYVARQVVANLPFAAYHFCGKDKLLPSIYDSVIIFRPRNILRNGVSTKNFLNTSVAFFAFLPFFTSIFLCISSLVPLDY